MDGFSQRLSNGYDLLCELAVLMAVGWMLLRTYIEYDAGGLALIFGSVAYYLIIGLPLALALVWIKRPLFGLISLLYRPVELIDQ